MDTRCIFHTIKYSYIITLSLIHTIISIHIEGFDIKQCDTL